MLYETNWKFQKHFFVYKCAFLIYTLFLATDFVKIKSFGVIKIILMIWGIALLGYDIYRSKGKVIYKNILLTIFTIISAISIINNGNFADIKLYLITLIEIFVLNNYDSEKFSRNEIKIINFILILLTLVLTSSALILEKKGFLIGNIYLVDTFGNSLFKGFYIISTTSGMISYLSTAITIISLFTIKKNKKYKNIIRVMYALNIIVQTYAAFKSGVRGAVISIVVFCFISIYMFIKSKKIRNAILGIIISIVFSFPIYKPLIENNEFLNKNPGTSFLSGRVTLWEEGYENIFKKYPMSGGAPNNMILELKESSSKELIGIDGGRIHNIYLDVLYSAGIIGSFSLFLFIIISIIKFYKGAFNYELDVDTLKWIKLIFSFLCSILILNFVESLLIYTVNLAGIMFWVYMSYGKRIINDMKSNF